MVPARFLLAVAIGFAAIGPGSSKAQTPSPAAARNPAASGIAAPDSVQIAKLVWSAISALDHANSTGNYSVLRELGAPAFQSANSASSLATTFQALRLQQVDLGNALIVSPTYEFPPAIVNDGLLRVRGLFPLRPSTIRFDLLFQSVGGRWRLFGIAVVAVPVAQSQPDSTRR